MRVETQHAPHGIERPDEWPCPKCQQVFPALCVLIAHQRKEHGERGGLSR